MSEFITGERLKETIADIIWKANQNLLIISPYIKLDDYFRSVFRRHINKADLHIIIVFGKNEDDIHRSFSKTDIEFFKEFPNISIIHAPKLHGKYYGNENSGVVTSMNFYDYSYDNNIEFGVYTEHNLITKLSSTLTGRNTDDDAWYTCYQIACDHNPIFIKRPVYENKKFIINLSRNFINSEILHDTTKDQKWNKQGKIKHLEDFPEELELSDKLSVAPKKETYKKQTHGYCIRTGEEIPYNPSQPLSYHAWQTWNQFGNPDFPEKFCHKTGRQSYGKTSMRSPILN